ncbi:hypothetical protein BKA65DRAFT_538063 [Rhexocercosporidium sp. MPI-PUGE-AT-0058]|nr:hypothetical protein BKA65DRAFT_538063 [Rhexocercosporidium sp. MPI-PUGE-AT-0058]
MASQPDFIRIPSRRSVVHSTNGMVACTQPLAASCGLKILASGGNAADAAVAVDPNEVEVPTKQLVSREYLAERAKLFDPKTASHIQHHGSPAHNHSDTVYFAVSDRDGNAVSFINSNYGGFGMAAISRGKKESRDRKKKYVILMVPSLKRGETDGRSLPNHKLVTQHSMRLRAKSATFCTHLHAPIPPSDLVSDLTLRMPKAARKKQYMCTVPGCEKKFATTDQYNTHMRWGKHRTDTDTGSDTDDAKYKCETCNKSFKKAAYLQKHKKIHQQEKLYCPAENCNKSYTRQSRLDKHVASHSAPKKPRKKSQEKDLPLSQVPTCCGTYEEAPPKEHARGSYVVPFTFLAPIIPRKPSYGPEVREEDINVIDADDDDEEWDEKDEDDADLDGHEVTSMTPAFMDYSQKANDKFMEYYSGTYSGFRSEPRLSNDTETLCRGMTRTNTKMPGAGISLSPTCVLCQRRANAWFYQNKVRDALAKGQCGSSKHCEEPSYRQRLNCKKHVLLHRLQSNASMAKRIIAKRKISKRPRTEDTELHHFLQKKGDRLQTPENKAALKDLYNRLESGRGIYSIDLEFVNNFIIEICILDHSGNIIIDTKVDYEISTLNLYDQVTGTANSRQRELGNTLRRIYGPPSANTRTGGQTPSAIIERLTAAKFDHDTMLLEWSANWCDFYRLQYMLLRSGNEDLIPRKSIRILQSWRNVLPGFVSFTLSFFFSWVFPDRMDLVVDAHLAYADTMMLYLLTQKLLETVFK